jgi:hypothetical protein
MRIVDRHALIEDVLDVWAAELGSARRAYAGHAYRVFNVTRALAGVERDELAAASIFHDLGIWSDRTFDYLAPSSARARAHLETARPELAVELVVRMIDNHHCVRRVRRGADAIPVEAFRQADLVDLSAGAFRFGVDVGFLRELRAAFPNAGFHGLLARTAFGWFVRHPLRPLPMLRLSAPEPRADRA